MTTTAKIPPFNPPPQHTTHETTLSTTATSRLEIYNCTPPSSPPSSWVTVTYIPPTAPSSSEDPESTPEKHTLLTIPPHWHAHHDEVMTILSGKLKFTIDGVERVVGAGEELLIRRGAVHGFTVLRGVPATFRERALVEGWEEEIERKGEGAMREGDGNGNFKGAFFKDLFSQGGPPPVLHAMRTFSEGDTFVHVPLPAGGSKWLDWILTHALGALARLVLPARDAGNMIAGMGVGGKAKQI